MSDERIAESLLVKQASSNSDRPNVVSVTDSKQSYLPLMGHGGSSIMHPVTYNQSPSKSFGSYLVATEEVGACVTYSGERGQLQGTA